MKRTYVVLTVMVMFCMLPVVAVAFNDEMKVFVNGNRIEVDLLPQVHDEVVFYRFVCSKIRLNLEWL